MCLVDCHGESQTCHEPASPQSADDTLTEQWGCCVTARAALRRTAPAIEHCRLLAVVCHKQHTLDAVSQNAN